MNTLFALILFATTSISCVFTHSDIPYQTQKPMTYLALGDSYTIGTSLDNEADSYPMQLATKLNKAEIPMRTPQIIAKNGWTTGDLLKATNKFQPDSTFTLVSLLIGVNNQYQGLKIESYRIEFTQLLQRSIQYAGGDKSSVFVFSIPDYGVTPFGINKDSTGHISTQIDEYNTVNHQIAEQLGVSYYDITAISRTAGTDPALIASDGLHPSGKMYELWINAYFDDIKMKINA